MIMTNKHFTHRKVVFMMFLMVLSFSCQDRLDDLRDNPNAVIEIDDAALFTKAVRSLFQDTTDDAAARFAGQYGHYFVAGSTARLPDQYGDGFDVQYNQMFTNMYGGVIRHIEEVLEITASGETKNEVRHAMADVIAVLGYAKLTDAYGEIPYFEGGKGKTEGILRPKYDTQKAIYEDMLQRLAQSITVLKTADPAMGYPNADPIYYNDMNKWVRFANSVRLRLAMRLRNADTALSKQTVAQCLSEPLMEINDQNAAMIETEGNGNKWYTMRTGFPSIKMSNMLINQLKNTEDPRLPVFVNKDANGDYSGMTNGLDDTAFGNSNFSTKSDIGTALSSKESKLYLMTASEVWLLRAEAAFAYAKDLSQANDLYRKGIETSLQQWDVKSDVIAEFMARSEASLAGNPEAQIGTQMWLALIPNYFEGWTYIRRTGYPNIETRTADNLAQGVTNGVLPKRFLYSSFELSSNRNNVLEAVSRQGDNKIDTPVWWDKN